MTVIKLGHVKLLHVQVVKYLKYQHKVYDALLIC